VSDSHGSPARTCVRHPWSCLGAQTHEGGLRKRKRLRCVVSGQGRGLERGKIRGGHQQAGWKGRRSASSPGREERDQPGLPEHKHLPRVQKRTKIHRGAQPRQYRGPGGCFSGKANTCTRIGGTRKRRGKCPIFLWGSDRDCIPGGETRGILRYYTVWKIRCSDGD